MAYSAQFGSGINLEALMVPTQSATVYAAQESSLYLPGSIIPIQQVAQGSATAQVAVMGTSTVQTVAGDGATPQTEDMDPGVDFTAYLPSNTKTTIALDLIATRTVIRDLGGADFNDFGRILGNAIGAEVDKRSTGALAGLTIVAPGGVSLLNDLYDAISTVRAAGETGPLNCVVNAAKYGEFMKVIGSSAFAAADLQNLAMRSGYLGTIAGVPCFTTAYMVGANLPGMNSADFAVFSADAVRIAMQGGVKVEFERQSAAVGTSITASAAYGVATIDTTRGVISGVVTP